MDDENIKNSSKISESQEKFKEKNEIIEEEEIEIEEVENEEEEDIKSSSKGEKTNTINSLSKESSTQEKYLLELNTSGLLFPYQIILVYCQMLFKFFLLIISLMN